MGVGGLNRIVFCWVGFAYPTKNHPALRATGVGSAGVAGKERRQFGITEIGTPLNRRFFYHDLQRQNL
jgi:hypothetical protein